MFVYFYPINVNKQPHKLCAWPFMIRINRSVE